MGDFYPFLKSVAESLKNKCGNNPNLSEYTLVFPNKRATLFFNRYLYQVYNPNGTSVTPVLTPRYVTIGDLFARFSKLLEKPLKVLAEADKLELIYLLYQAYCEVYSQHLKELPDDAQPKMNVSQTFDEFYFFGEMLLKDFGDVDKNMVDASKLFRNFKDYAELGDSKDYLTDDQKEALEHFFKIEFNDKNELYRNFISLWEILDKIYENFRYKLLSKSIAYDGMYKRMVVEALKQKGLNDCSDKFVVVGFNALDVCEKEFFKLLHNAGVALFYWDYDSRYFDANGKSDSYRAFYKDDAGTFLRQNLCSKDENKSKPNAKSVFIRLGNESKEFNHDFLGRFSAKDAPKIKVLASPTNSGMAKYVATYLREKKAAGVSNDDIGVVLCDESLLLPVLHSIPEEIGTDVNVTMGFPVVQTPAYALLCLLLDLQQSRGKNTKYLFPQVAALLRHSEVKHILGPLANYFVDYLNKLCRYYISDAEIEAAAKDKDFDNIADLREFLPSKVLADSRELLQWLLTILTKTAKNYRSDVNSDKEDGNNIVGLKEEALYRVCELLGQLKNLLHENPDLELSVPLMSRLIRRMFACATVNYSGEPARGMQIMGFLETRNLDFKHLLVMSVNEDSLPKSGNNISFIPYNLRVAFGMPTIEHEDALYAYNFYRLLQRPESVTVLYNSNTADNAGGEPSRFLRQLKSEFSAFDDIQTLPAPVVPNTSSDAIVFAKSEEAIQKIKDTYGDNGSYPLSPSALNTYQNCSLQFYFKYVLGLKEEEDFDENLDSSMFGNIFHTAMQCIYEGLYGKSGKQVAANSESKSKTNQNRPHETTDYSLCVDTNLLGNYVKRNPNGEFQFSENLIENAVIKGFEKQLKTDITEDKLTGEQQIKKNVIVKLVKHQLAFDYSYAEKSNFVMHKPEFHVSQPVNIELKDGSHFNFWLGGIIDRHDEKEGVLRIVDYKSGKDADGKKRSAENQLQVFGKNEEGEALKMGNKGYIFQISLYSYLLRTRAGEHVQDYLSKDMPVQPVLMFPLEMKMSEIDKYNPDIKLGVKKDANTLVFGNAELPDVEAEFEVKLKDILKEILDADKPFVGSKYDEHCTYCQFLDICHREIKKDF